MSPLEFADIVHKIRTENEKLKEELQRTRILLQRAKVKLYNYESKEAQKNAITFSKA